MGDVRRTTTVNVYVPRDKVTTQHNGYGFVEFRSEEDAEYAIKIMNMIKLYGKGLRVNRVRAPRLCMAFATLVWRTAWGSSTKTHASEREETSAGC